MTGSDGDSGASDQELPDDVVADLLSVDRRRHALDELAQRETAMVIDDLAAAVLARERDVTPSAIGETERRTVRDEFFQHHLPKLTATDVVRYNSMLGTVELARPETVGDALDVN